MERVMKQLTIIALLTGFASLTHAADTTLVPSPVQATLWHSMFSAGLFVFGTVIVGIALTTLDRFNAKRGKAMPVTLAEQ